MKVKDKDAEMAQLTKDLTDSFDRWDYIMKHGSSDPFWPDGTGLNLVRNHILYYKNAMKELVEGDSEELNLFSQTYPDIYYRDTPDKVSYDYVVNADEIRQRAQEQLALYESDPNFLYCLENHPKVFPEGKETKATKKAGLSVYRSSGLSRYRKDIEADDLVSMRRDFCEPYEAKAARWAEGARALKAFLEKEHSPDDDIVVADDLEAEDAYYEEVEQEPKEIPKPKPTRKPSLDAQIHSAQAVAEKKGKKHEVKAEQLSLF